MNTQAADHKTALVLLSGGMDSAYCLFWALKRFQHVLLIGFDYGQRHRIELEIRAKFLQQLAVSFPALSRKIRGDHIIPLPSLQTIDRSALTQNIEITQTDGQLPNSFVPGRNLLFFTLAAALAWQHDCHDMVGGMCQTDHANYPDCRHNALQSLQTSLSLGMDYDLTIHTPLMFLTKAQTWQHIAEEGGLELLKLITHTTHSCYYGDRLHSHDWGYGCGECPACQLRAQGWHDYMQSTDKLAGL